MKILAYRTAWNASDNIGSIRLYTQEKQWTKWINFSSIQEYQVVLMLLQNERPVFYEYKDGKGYYYTDVEEPGIQD